MKRRDALASLLCAALPVSGRAASFPAPAASWLGDFDEAWRLVDRAYIRFDRFTRARWNRARRALRERAARAASVDDLAQVVEGFAETLRDDQVMLALRRSRPVRRIPAETDVWAAWRGGAALVEAVRASGEADVAGLQPGHVVEAIDGIPAKAAVERRVGSDAPPRDRHWGLRKLLAGPWTGPVRLDVRDARGAPHRMTIDRHAPRLANAAMPGRRMGEARDIGYIRLRDRAWEHVEECRAALASVQGTRALIVDLRDVSSPAPSQHLAVLAGAFDRAAPRAVLVDRWTAGAGELLAAGLGGRGAQLVGTRTAGVGTEMAEHLLPHSQLRLQFPVAWSVRPDGTRVDRMVPERLVDLAAPSGGPGDPILYQALKLLA